MTPSDAPAMGMVAALLFLPSVALAEPATVARVIRAGMIGFATGLEG